MSTLLILLVLALIWLGLRDTRQSRVSSYRDRSTLRGGAVEQRPWRARRGERGGGNAPTSAANSLAS